MKTLVIACTVMESEMRRVAGEMETPPEFIFLEAALHDKPTEYMKAVLQKALDEVPPEVGRVIMGYGLCGGAVNGLFTRHYELVITKINDCVPLLCGSYDVFNEASKIPSFFLTKGWIEFTNEVFYDTAKRLGPARTAKVYKIMLANYKRFLFIDNGAYNLDEAREAMAERIALHGLEEVVIKGDLGWIRQLLTGPWADGPFIVTPPDSQISWGE